jgi:hypothetical protein
MWDCARILNVTKKQIEGSVESRTDGHIHGCVRPLLASTQRYPIGAKVQVLFRNLDEIANERAEVTSTASVYTFSELSMKTTRRRLSI